jgi:phosphoadenosine phosphosulfate reductase
MPNTIQDLETIQGLLANKTPIEALRILADRFVNQIVFSTSLGIEDQVVSDMILSHNIPIKIFTLDTGRQFEETYKTLQQTNRQYETNIEVYAPERSDTETLVSAKGPYSFYESVENRKECCFLRKVKPLNRALANHKIWVTGIRAEQSANRQEMNQLEWDEAHQLFKFHPILDWTFDQTKQYIKQHSVPYNVLHDRGFVSIGCAPCTRAVAEGEDFRAGRWWWEDQSKKECGLHNAGR